MVLVQTTQGEGRRKGGRYIKQKVRECNFAKVPNLDCNQVVLQPVLYPKGRKAESFLFIRNWEAVKIFPMAASLVSKGAR